MNDEQKTTAQLISELAELRRTVSALQFADAERRQVNVSSQEREHLLNKVEQMGQIGHWCWNLAANSLSWSDELFRIFGVTRDFELTYQNIEAMIHPEDRADNQRQVNAMLSDVAVVSIELRIFRPDHTMRWIQQTTETSRDASGQMTSIFGIMQDITDRKRAEDELRQYHRIISSTPDGIALVDRSYRYLIVNDAYERFSGVARDKFLGLTVAEYLGEEVFQQQVKPQFDRCLQGETITYRSWFDYPTLGRRFVEVTYFPYRDACQQIIGLVSDTRDITDYKLAEEALRESEERLQLAMKATNDVVWDWDITHDSQRWNEAGILVFGWVDIVAQPQTSAWWVERVHPDDRQRVADKFYAAVADSAQSHWQDEYRFRKTDDSYARVLDRGYIKRNEQGQPVRMIGAMLDITERKRAEEALRESEEKYHRLFELESDALFLLSKETADITEANAAAVALYQYRRDELLTMKALHLSAEPDKSRQAMDDTSGLVPIRYHRKQDGTIFPVEITFRDFDYSGHPMRIAAVHDITDRKRAEEQLKNQNVLLEQAVQQKQREMEALYDKLLRQEKLATIGQMAGSIAHELRNPLGAVKQSVYYLKRLAHNQELTPSNPKALRHLDLIDAELETSARVIADLLDMTHMKPPQCQPTSMRLLIEELLQRCHLPEQVQVTTSLQPESLTVVVDPLQMRQVLLNVLTNAAQAIEGDGAITVSAKQLTEPGETVIEVHDSGGGIAPDALSKVFEPLYTTKANGTGLGLSICKQIIENHGGQIAVTSQPGQGTTVTIVLPCHH